MSDLMLQTNDLTIRFDAERALRFGDLSLTQGEKLLLRGASGSGKSTLLLLIAGALTPTHGDIVFQGQSHSDLTSRQLDRLRARRIGLVFQTLNLIDYLDGYANLALPLTLRGLKPNTDHVQSLCQQMELDPDCLTRTPDQLSIGQQQRIAVIRALITEPALILADEPTSALDPDASAGLLTLLTQSLNPNQSLLMVSHQTEIDSLFDRVIQLESQHV